MDNGAIYRVNGDRGGVAVFWHDRAANRLRELWCFSVGPDGCVVSTADIRWEGNDLVLTDTLRENGRTVYTREVWTDITPRGHTVRISQGPSPEALSVFLVSKAVRDSAG